MAGGVAFFFFGPCPQGSEVNGGELQGVCLWFQFKTHHKGGSSTKETHTHNTCEQKFVFGCFCSTRLDVTRLDVVGILQCGLDNGEQKYLSMWFGRNGRMPLSYKSF